MKAWTLLDSFTEENWIHIMRVLKDHNNYTSTELAKRIESVIFPEVAVDYVTEERDPS